MLKAFEKFEEYEYAQSIAIQHIYSIINVLYPREKETDNIYKSYKPFVDMPSEYKNGDLVETDYIYTIGIITITLVIENVFGFDISFA